MTSGNLFALAVQRATLATVSRLPRHLRVVLLVLAVALLAVPAAASAAVPGTQTLKYKFGPIHITPGQNTIELKATDQRPTVPGYITRFKPDLVRVKDGSIPRVDVLHLHHGVWLLNGNPTFAAGEEKTIIDSPKGYGWSYKPSDTWLVNYMIHNLLPNEDDVYMTYEIDFIPLSSPAAQGMKTVRTKWLDVEGLQAYPVFDALKGAGKKGKYTYPNDEPDAYADQRRPRNQWVVDRGGTLVGTAGHLHPGGLYTDMWLSRAGKTVRLFRSKAKYWEPAGAVSWDVAMTATPEDWRVQVQKGDIVTVSGTYDTKRASWYESMAIMPVTWSPGDTAGKNPFVTDVDKPGKITHGPLRENRVHGGGPGGLPDARRLLDGPILSGNSGVPTGTSSITVNGFVYGRGDLSLTGRKGRPPVIKRGQSLTFANKEPLKTVWHTITACKAPCNKSTGIAYPLADAKIEFDSGQLGYGPRGFTAAANRDTWETPKNLPRGTYNYFCRVHPFMRGAFRVKN